MSLVIEQLRAGGATVRTKRKGSKLDQLRKEFRQVEIDLEKPPFSWNALNQMRVLRNCIAHTDGWITEAFAEKLKNVGIGAKEDTPLGPPRQTLNTGGGW